MTARQSNDDDRLPVTVLGLGAMGRALAGGFLASGHSTTVWNRSPEKAKDLVARGATMAATVTNAVTASPTVLICVLNDDAVRQVLDPAADTLTGRTLVNLTNGTPKQARKTADWAAGYGAAYLDGGIMAVPPMIGRPEAFVLYSGSSDVFEASERTLGALGTATYVGADAGRAALYDIALLSAMYGMFGGFLHAIAMVESERVPATEFTPLVLSWLTAMTASLPTIATAVDSGNGSAHDSNLEMQAIGFVNLLDASRDQGVSTELMEPMRALLDRAVATGHGGGGLSNLVELLRTDDNSGEGVR